MPMRWFRKHQKKFLAFLAAFLMGSWLVGSALYSMIAGVGRTNKDAGKIFGETITQIQFDAMKQRWRRWESSLRRNANYQEIRELVNNQYVWEKIMFLHEADRLGITVSDKELAHWIKITFGGGDEANFNSAYYDAFLARQNWTRKGFEGTARVNLIIGKLQSFIESSVKVSTDEARRRYKRENDQLKVKYVAFKPEDFADSVKLTANDIEEFYQEHKDIPVEKAPTSQEFSIGYKEPEKVQIEYIMANYLTLEDFVTVTEDEARDFYEDNKDARYKAPEPPKQPKAPVAPKVSSKKVSPKSLERAADKPKTPVTSEKTEQRADKEAAGETRPKEESPEPTQEKADSAPKSPQAKPKATEKNTQAQRNKKSDTEKASKKGTHPAKKSEDQSEQKNDNNPETLRDGGERLADERHILLAEAQEAKPKAKSAQSKPDQKKDVPLEKEKKSTEPRTPEDTSGEGKPETEPTQDKPDQKQSAAASDNQKSVEAKPPKDNSEEEKTQSAKPKYRPYEEVKDQILRELTQKKAKELADKRINEADEKIKGEYKRLDSGEIKKIDFLQIAKELDLEFGTSEPFSKRQAQGSTIKVQKTYLPKSEKKANAKEKGDDKQQDSEAEAKDKNEKKGEPATQEDGKDKTDGKNEKKADTQKTDDGKIEDGRNANAKTDSQNEKKDSNKESVETKSSEDADTRENDEGKKEDADKENDVSVDEKDGAEEDEPDYEMFFLYDPQNRQAQYDFAKAAFALPVVEEASNIMSSVQGKYIFQIIEKIDPAAPELDPIWSDLIKSDKEKTEAKTYEEWEKTFNSLSDNFAGKSKQKDRTGGDPGAQEKSSDAVKEYKESLDFVLRVANDTADEKAWEEAQFTGRLMLELTKQNKKDSISLEYLQTGLSEDAWRKTKDVVREHIAEEDGLEKAEKDSALRELLKSESEKFIEAEKRKKEAEERKKKEQEEKKKSEKAKTKAESNAKPANPAAKDKPEKKNGAKPATPMKKGAATKKEPPAQKAAAEEKPARADLPNQQKEAEDKTSVKGKTEDVKEASRKDAHPSKQAREETARDGGEMLAPKETPAEDKQPEPAKTEKKSAAPDIKTKSDREAKEKQAQVEDAEPSNKKAESETKEGPKKKFTREADDADAKPQGAAKTKPATEQSRGKDSKDAKGEKKEDQPPSKTEAEKDSPRPRAHKKPSKPPKVEKPKSVLEQGETNFFKRPKTYSSGFTSAYIQKLKGHRPEFARVAFTLEKDEIDIAIEDNKPRACYLIKVTEWKNVKETDFDKQPVAAKNNVFSSLLREKKEKVMAAWKAGLEERANIESNLSLFEAPPDSEQDED